jgi:chromosome segregation ATPase
MTRETRLPRVSGRGGYMKPRDVMKRIALSIPQVRSLYNHAGKLSVTVERLRKKLAAVETRLSNAEDEKVKLAEDARCRIAKAEEEKTKLAEDARCRIAKAEEEKTKLAEDARCRIANAEEEKTKLADKLADDASKYREETEKLNLRLYVLTSDFQRAVNRNEQLRTRVEQLESELKRLSAHIRETDSQDQ